MPHMIGPRNQPASSLNEGQARYILIDPALRDAGWNLEDRTQVGFEIPVDGYDAAPPCLRSQFATLNPHAPCRSEVATLGGGHNLQPPRPARGW